MTTQVIKPNGSLGLVGATVVGAGGVSYVATSDLSDATYMVGTANNGWFKQTFQDLTPLAGNQRVRSCQVITRNACSASFVYQSVTYEMTSTLPAGGRSDGTFTVNRGSLSILNITGPVCLFAPLGRPWTEAEVNGIAVYGQWHLNSAGGASFQRIHELSISVEINEQPAVTTPVVTNFNASNPTVTWTYSDADGDLQTYYRIKIFDQATYTTGNFDPATSMAVFDSWEVPGADVTAVLNAQLQNGVTYKAYVKAAQTWVQTVGGSAPPPLGGQQSHIILQTENTQLWWSAWQASAPFTPVLIPPYTPVLTATQLIDDQQTRALLTVSSPVNLLSYDASSFEASLGGWTADTNMAAPTSVTVDASDGTHSMQMSSSAAGNMIAKSGFDALGGPKVGGGKQYTGLASFHAATVGRNVSVGFRWIDITGAAIGADVFGSTVADVTTGTVYTQASVTATAPGNAVQVILLARVAATAGAAEVHRVDKASVAAGASTTWTLGGMTSDPTKFIIERGERVDVRRGTAENWMHPQVASAGTQLKTAGFGFDWDAATQIVTWQRLNKQILTSGETPMGMLHWQPRTAANNFLRFGTWSFWPETDWNMPVVVGQVHIFSCWAWTASGTFTTTPKIEWLNDANDSVNSTSTGVQVTLTTTPQRISFSATCPAGASAARTLITNDGSSATADVYVTRLGWGLGTVPVDGKPARGGSLVWTQVRDYQFPADWVYGIGYGQGETEIFTDFECPHGRPVLYRARNEWFFSTAKITSANSAYVTLNATPPARTMLRSVADPMLFAAVNRNKSLTFHHDEDAQIFHPLGRNANPVKIRDYIGGEDGEFTFITINESQATRLDNLIASSGPLIVNWAQGGRSYVIITGRALAEEMRYFNWCDLDGNTVDPYLRYDVHTLTYLETGMP